MSRKREWPAREPASEWNPPTEQLLVTGKLPDCWFSDKHWIDLVPGAQLVLDGKIIFTCLMDLIDGQFHLRLEYQMGDHPHGFTAELGGVLDLSLITGHPCVLIPRAIKPANTELPAGVLLEFARVVSQ